jgi:predicted nucleotidyltransferase
MIFKKGVNIMLSERDQNILAEFAFLVRERFSNARIWAFGSRTRGEATEESDMDVCVVVNRLDDSIDKAIMDIAWQVGFEHDVIISTVTYSRQEFEKGPCSESTFVQNVLNAGVAA